MFTYVCLGTNDINRSAVFYDAVLGALGLRRCDTSDEPEWDGWIGWGIYTSQGAQEVALWLCAPFNGQPTSAGNGTMIALKAHSWDQVDAFHAAALARGGTSEGSPGLRLQYNPDFYAAYIRDPDGNKLAAVCRGFTQRTSLVFFRFCNSVKLIPLIQHRCSNPFGGYKVCPPYVSYEL